MMSYLVYRDTFTHTSWVEEGIGQIGDTRNGREEIVAVCATQSEADAMQAAEDEIWDEVRKENNRIDELEAARYREQRDRIAG